MWTVFATVVTGVSVLVLGRILQHFHPRSGERATEGDRRGRVQPLLLRQHLRERLDVRARARRCLPGEDTGEDREGGGDLSANSARASAQRGPPSSGTACGSTRPGFPASPPCAPPPAC